MSKIISVSSRIEGALLGCFIGDALALGCHWFYDLAELKEKYGWVTNYVEPSKGRYHYGYAKAGDFSQTSEFTLMMAESLSSCGALNLSDFGRRLDDFFPSIDGTPLSGKAGYSDSQVRDLYENRVKRKLDWFHPEMASWAETSEASQRSVGLAALYYNEPAALGEAAYQNARFTYRDPMIVSQSSSFTVLLGGLISGKFSLNEPAPLSHYWGSFVTTQRSKGFNRAPQNLMRFDAKAAPFLGVELSSVESFNEPAIGFPDSAFSPLSIIDSVKNGAHIEPPVMASSVFGLPCGVGAVLNGSYYLATKYSGDFKAGIEMAVNGGGQNVARASHVGALIGAHVGIEGIPQELIRGLNQNERILEVAKKIAALAVKK